MAVKQNLDFSTHDFVKGALQDNKTIERALETLQTCSREQDLCGQYFAFNLNLCNI